MSTKPSPTVPFLKAVLWLTIGTALGFGIGILVFRLAADPSDGFADLAAFAGSLFTYAPVGGLSGLALGLRKRPWPLPRMVLGGLVLAAIPVVLVRDSHVTAWGLAAYVVASRGIRRLVARRSEVRPTDCRIAPIHSPERDSLTPVCLV